jgi:hypothetical protein
LPGKKSSEIIQNIREPTMVADPNTNGPAAAPSADYPLVIDRGKQENQYFLIIAAASEVIYI